jgi:hypothetical protein
LESGTSYFTLDTGLDWLITQANKEAERGRPVLLLTRRPRSWLERRHDLEGIQTLNFKHDKTQTGDDALHPENIGRIFTSIRDFLECNKEPLVIFDGADLLTFYNGFGFFIKLLYTVNDIIWSSKGNVVFLIDPTSFRRKELHIIQKELDELRNPKSKVDIEDAAES